MSQHIVEDEKVKWVFGWDQPMLTFFLQKHDKTLGASDMNPVVWAGTRHGEIYEVDELVKVARNHGLRIDHRTRVLLYGDQDDGR